MASRFSGLATALPFSSAEVTVLDEPHAVTVGTDPTVTPATGLTDAHMP